VIGNTGRTWVMSAMLIMATGVTLGIDRWVMGPGTTAPVNGYRFPLFDFNQPVDFGYNTSLFALVEGWNAPEQHGVWAWDRKATIAFRLPAAPPTDDGPTLRLRFGAYLVAPKPTVQRISVWAGPRKLGEAALTASEAEVMFSLKGLSLLRDPAPIMLTFEMPDAIPPLVAEGHGSSLPRSIALLSLEITR
jgi:hypothetical protein